MVDIEEFKQSFKDGLLHHTFEEQKEVRKKYDVEIRHTLNLMNNYLIDVQHVMEQNMDIAIISHLSYNLNLQLLQCYKYVDEAYEVKHLFLYGEEYQKDYDNLNEYQKYGTEIKKFIYNLSQRNLFDIYQAHPGHIFLHPQLNIPIEGKNNSLLILERDLAFMNGAQIVKCLEYLIGWFEKQLITIKEGGLYDDNVTLQYIYDLNCVYYSDYYWDKEREHFRNHITNEILINGVTIDRLYDQYRDIVKDFKTNETGKIWEKYSDDKANLVLELKRVHIDITQWEYFFKTLFQMEEIKRWINELKAPKKTVSGLRQYVVKPEIADLVVGKITSYVNTENKPKPIVRPIRAAMDSGVLHRPSWDAFVEDYGPNKISSKTSFNDYTNPEKEHYNGASYNALVDEFKKFLE